jgi:predicted O-methyltransferase YrrM
MSSTQPVLEKIEALSKQENDLPILGARKGKLLADEVRAAKPRHILEVGTLIGYSAILMAAELEPGARITCVELSADNAAKARKNFADAGVAGRIEVVVGRGTEVIPTLTGPFDFMFIDAAKKDYLAYLKAAEPNLTKNAVVVADNVGMFRKEVTPYLDHVKKGGGYTSETHDFGTDAVEVSRRKG